LPSREERNTKEELFMPYLGQVQLLFPYESNLTHRPSFKLRHRQLSSNNSQALRSVQSILSRIAAKCLKGVALFRAAKVLHLCAQANKSN
jgi:hypothetical protein